MKSRAAWLILTASLLLACGTASAPDASSSPGTSSTSEEELRTKRRHDAGAAACIATNDACGTSASHVTGTCCDPQTRCIEYTVYDYARCRKPSVAGVYCYRDDQCASGSCDNGSCAP